MVHGLSGRRSIGPLSCQETRVSRTAIRLVAVVFPFWSKAQKYCFAIPISFFRVSLGIIIPENKYTAKNRYGIQTTNDRPMKQRSIDR